MFSAEGCEYKLALRYFDISDDNIDGSKSRDGSKPSDARNLMFGDESDRRLTNSAWYPDESDDNPFWEVQFPEALEVISILTQGDGSESYAPEIFVFYKPIGEDAFEPISPEDGTISFSANSDARNLTEILMPQPITATAFRIRLKTDVDGGSRPLALRVEFRVCLKAVTVPVVTVTTTKTVTEKTTQTSSESSTATTELATSTPTERPTEIIQTTVTVTKKTSPVTPTSTETTEQPSETTTVVSVTRNMTEITSTEITQTVSQSTVKTTESPITSSESTTSTHPTSTAAVATLSTTVAETTPEKLPEVCDKFMELEGKDTNIVEATYSASSNEIAAKYASFESGRDDMWRPEPNTKDGTFGDFVEVQFKYPVFVTAIKTKGDTASESTQSYLVYSSNAAPQEPVWSNIAQFDDGPTDITTETLEGPVKTDVVRISVNNTADLPALKFSVVGCFDYSPFVIPTEATTATATSEVTSPTILVSTTVTETKPVTTTRSFVTGGTETPHTTSPVVVTQSSTAKPEVTTSVTVSTKKPEVTSTTEKKVSTTATSTTGTGPIASTASTFSTTGQPQTESSTSETTSHVETATTGVATSEKPSSPTQTPAKTTSIVQTTTAKVETVESTTISM